MTYLTRPYHIPCDACQAVAYTMPWPSGHTIYHAISTRPYHTPCHALPGHALPYFASPDHTLYHIIPGHTICHARPYHIPCHARQPVPYTIVRPYHILCYAIYHAMPLQTIPYTILCPLGHTICHAMSYHIPCHVTANDYFGKMCHLSEGANDLVTR